MHPLTQELVAAELRERLSQAESRRAGERLARARRLSRKAERSAARARVALARVL